jgi:hypothetical protein
MCTRELDPHPKPRVCVAVCATLTYVCVRHTHPRVCVRRLANIFANSKNCSEVSSKKDCFGLTVKIANGSLKNHLLERTPHIGGINGSGFFFGGQTFSTIARVVATCAQQVLPVLGVRLLPNAAPRAVSPASPTRSRAPAVTSGGFRHTPEPMSPGGLSEFERSPDGGSGGGGGGGRSGNRSSASASPTAMLIGRLARLSGASAGDDPANAERGGQVDTLTSAAEWFVAGVDRGGVKEMTLEIMRRGEPGDFLVRDVASEPGHFGLAVKSETGLLNYLIERIPSQSYGESGGAASPDRWRCVPC